MKTTKESEPTDKVLRDALAKIKMPPPEKPFGHIARILRELSPKSGGKFDPARVQAILNEIVSTRDPSQRFLDWKGQLFPPEPCPIDILAGLYVPTMDTPPLGLSDHVYWSHDIDFMPPSSASASINTGNVGLSAVLNADNFVPESSVAASATTWIKVDTSQPGYGSPNVGSPNVLTFTPRINWQAAIQGFGDHAWANAGATGPLDVVGWVTLVAARLDGQPGIVTNSDFQIFQFETTRLGDDQTQNFNGTFRTPTPQFKVMAASGAIYALGARVLARITSNIVNGFGGAVPSLTKGSPFSWSGTITATIPFMELTHGDK